MNEYTIMWKSTPHERYNTDMNDRARALVVASGVEIRDDFGGSSIEEADNGFDVRAASHRPVVALAEAIAAEVGYVVEVRDDEYIRVHITGDGI